MYLQSLGLLVIAVLANSQEVKRIGPGEIPYDKQTYNFDPESRCAVLSHQSAVLKNNDHHILIIDGGMAKFKFLWNSESVEVLDLNPYTIAIDLSREFNSYTLAPLWHVRKPLNVPVLNRFSMWADSTQDYIYIQGGHFYDAPKWNESRYHPTKEDIPGYSIWRFDVRSEVREWSNITKSYGFDVERTLAGAAVSIPEQNQSYYINGITNPRSSSESPLDTFSPQVGMLVYNHTSGTLTNEPYFGEEEKYGYWHGKIFHLPVGCGKGFLISLAPERAKAGITIPDPSTGNDETGEPVLFNHVMIYDLDKKKWSNQSTTFFNDERPTARTRFCGATVYSAETNTWELWIHGGMQIDDKYKGVDEMWVLTMPSFIWTKIFIPFGNTHLRGHTCHAVGEQLLIVGGYPPGKYVNETATCDPQLVKVFNMRNPGWKNKYELNTTYKTPPEVIANAELDFAGHRKPREGWADQSLGNAFESCSPEVVSPTPTKTGLSKAAIAAIVVGCVVAICIGAYTLHLIIQKWFPINPSTPVEDNSSQIIDPPL